MSSKALYACVLCGEDFTRHSSGKRHSRNVHNSIIVRYNEYISGRASGLYPAPIAPRRLFRKSKLAGDVIAADYTIDNNSCGNLNSVNSDSWANNGNHSPKLGHTCLQTRGKESNLIDRILNDVCKVIEFKDLCSKLSYSQPIQNFVPLQQNFNIIQLDTALKNTQSPLNTKSELPFGFRVHTCAICLESPIVPVLYPTKKEAMNEVTHECRPENIAALGHIHNKTHD